MVHPNLLGLLHLVNPYEDLDSSNLKENFDQSINWGSEEDLFDDLICEIKPDLIIEVGSWKGASAVRMGKLLKKRGLHGQIICVDTWLGEIENWTDKSNQQFLKMHRGFPTVFYRFIQNVVANNLQLTIIPLPQTSSIGAKILNHHNIKADLIYIDANHEYTDVLRDLNDYWILLNKGGIMFGDDYHYRTGVAAAVTDFSIANKLHVNIVDRFWVLRK